MTKPLPLFPVFAGRDPLDLFKDPCKIVRVIHAAFLSDLFDRQVGKAQELFGVSDADAQQIGVDRNAVLFPENTGQIKLVEVKPF